MVIGGVYSLEYENSCLRLGVSTVINSSELGRELRCQFTLLRVLVNVSEC